MIVSLALRGNVVASDSDPNWWLGAVSAASAVFGALATIFIRGITGAEHKGNLEGRFLAWKDTVDAKAIETQARHVEVQAMAQARYTEMEARLTARITSIEARKDRIDARLENVVSRDEMNEGFDRISRQIERVDNYVRGDFARANLRGAGTPG